jgi:hypothetical protein
MSIGTVLLVILVIVLLGGFAGPSINPRWQYGYGYGHGGIGVVGIILIIVVAWLVFGGGGLHL